ncbi:hypothetical protein GCM10022221_26200 [Actinocorallia aurea]
MRAGLALLTALVALHVALCLPGLHKGPLGTGRAHSVTAPDGAHSPVHEDHRHDHHTSCEDSAAAWLDFRVEQPGPAVLAACAVLAFGLLPAGAARAFAGVADARPPGHWMRTALGGAMLPAALRIARI